MAYTRRRTTRRTGRSSYSARGRAAPRRTYRSRAPSRRRTSYSRGRSTGQTIRLVIEQPAASAVARPGMPVSINQMVADRTHKPKL